MKPTEIGTDEARKRLKALGDWQVRRDGKALVRRFKFRTFNEAFGFMARSALSAEKMNHHPTKAMNRAAGDI